MVHQFTCVSSPIWTFLINSANGLHSKFHLTQSVHKLYNFFCDRMTGDVSNKMLSFVTEKGFSEQRAWNECSVELVNAAKV